MMVVKYKGKGMDVWLGYKDGNITKEQNGKACIVMEV
jgi:hypothetical protein